MQNNMYTVGTQSKFYSYHLLTFNLAIFMEFIFYLDFAGMFVSKARPLGKFFISLIVKSFQSMQALEI